MTATELFEISGLTLRIAALATCLALPPAVGLGYILARYSFPGRSLAQAIIALPMVLPPVAVGLALLFLLGPQGPLSRLLSASGIQIVFTQWAAALAAATVGLPLFVRACQQAFEGVDRSYPVLARTLGHSRLQVFFRVSLPLARRGILYGALLCFTRGLGEFGATALVAGIIPGRTETLSLGIWSRTQWGDDASALTLCAVSFLLALASMWAAESWLGRGSRS